MATELTTPVGRIVWGHPAKARNVIDQDTKQPKKNADGTPVQEWSFGLAIPKAEFQAAVWPSMHAESATAYPNGVPNKFSWKYIDGDTVDGEGKPYSQREGYAGCYVLAITSRLGAVPMYKLNGGQYVQLPADAVKCGDYVAVGIELKVNVPTDRTHTPGLYVNPKALEFVGYGTEIVTVGHVDPNALFGGQARALPPGASATPPASAGAPGMPGMGAGAPPAPGQPGMMPPPGAPAPMTAPPAPVTPPPPPAPVAGPQRPTDPAHIANVGTPQEMWWNGAAWIAAPVAPPAQMPPPAPDFVNNAGMPGQMPGMMPPR